MPTQWYNIIPDLPEPPPPGLHPGTHEPIGPDDLAPLFPMALIMQGIAERQITRTGKRLGVRDDAAVRFALAEFEDAVSGGDNVMPPLIPAARVGVTLGEMRDVMRTEFGEFREPSPW